MDVEFYCRFDLCYEQHEVVWRENELKLPFHFAISIKLIASAKQTNESWKSICHLQELSIILQLSMIIFKTAWPFETFDLFNLPCQTNHHNLL